MAIINENIVTSSRTQHEIMKNWKRISFPLVSTCCITYNHELYIRQALDSFLMQETDFPFEIIVHDDASLDGTVDVIKAYAEKYPDIIRTILQSENQYSSGGLIYPRFVFPEARGKYIAICEGDDYWIDKDKLQKQVNFLEAHPDYVIVYSDCQAFDENGKIDKHYGGARRDLESFELKRATPIFTLTACFRNVIKGIPPDLLSARYGDLIIWSLLGSYGKGKYMPEVLPSAYRVHDGGIHSKKSNMKKHEMAVITRAALYTYYWRIGDVELSQNFKKKLLISVLLSMGWRGVSKSAYEVIRDQIGKIYVKITRNK